MPTRFALLVLTAAALTGCQAGEGAPPPPPTVVPTVQPATTSGSLMNALRLVRECRVHMTVSLHSGAFYLELKDGSRVDVPQAHKRLIHAEIERAQPPCKPVLISTE